MTNTESLPPVEQYNWSPLSVRRIGSITLAAGDMITDITNRTQLDKIENRLCSQISQAYPHSEMRRCEEPLAVVEKLGRLSQQVAPKPYEFRQGVALILPFDRRHVMTYPRPRFVKMVPWHQLTPHPEGLTCLFLADATIDDRSVSFAREAAYYLVRTSAQPALVVRRQSQGLRTHQTGDLVAHLRRASIRRGRDLRRYLDEYLYQGGLPGLEVKR